MKRDLQHINTSFRHKGKVNIIILLTVSLLVLFLAVFIFYKLNTPKEYNVILIGIDTLRADHLKCYGYQRDTAPNTDRIALQGSIFKRAYATTSWTLPSFHSIFTSLYQISHGVVTDYLRLDESFITMAEILKDNGFLTAGFISAPYLKSIFGFSQGFDLYEESPSSPNNPMAQSARTSHKLSKLVLPWIRKNRNERFFLFVHYWDPHYDFIPPKPYRKMFNPDYKGWMKGRDFVDDDRINPDMDEEDLKQLLALYDGEIRWTDSHLGLLFEVLEKLKLDDKTIIIIVGDHGEEFFEHGEKGHRNNLYNETIHVPLIFKIPGIKKPRTIEAVVSIVDILPTVLDILEIENPTLMEGRSLKSLIYGQEKEAHESVFSELDDYLISMIKGSWKIIHNSESHEFELYNIKDDPLEIHNVFNRQSTQAYELMKELISWQKIKEKTKMIAPKVIQDEKTLKQLKSLGYIK